MAFVLTNPLSLTNDCQMFVSGQHFVAILVTAGVHFNPLKCSGVEVFSAIQSNLHF